jgi:hypothetical protein
MSNMRRSRKPIIANLDRLRRLPPGGAELLSADFDTRKMFVVD